MTRIVSYAHRYKASAPYAGSLLAIRLESTAQHRVAGGAIWGSHATPKALAADLQFRSWFLRLVRPGASANYSKRA
jgi:hypothetical protein